MRETTTSGLIGPLRTDSPACSFLERPQYYKDNPEAVARRNKTLNAISRIAYRIAGSRRRFYELSPILRREIRDTARSLYLAGQTYTGAVLFEEVSQKGFVYVISNQAWPSAVKVGRACDPEARLSGFQTGSPYRDYELHYSVYFHNCTAAEQELHARLGHHCLGGEWFHLSVDQAVNAIDRLREVV